MKQTKFTIFMLSVLGMFVFAIGVHSASAEPSKVTKTPLMKQDMTIDGRLAVMVDVQLEPGSEEGRHSHPAEL